MDPYKCSCFYWSGSEFSLNVDELMMSWDLTGDCTEDCCKEEPPAADVVFKCEDVDAKKNARNLRCERKTLAETSWLSKNRLYDYDAVCLF